MKNILCFGLLMAATCLMVPEVVATPSPEIVKSQIDIVSYDFPSAYEFTLSQGNYEMVFNDFTEVVKLDTVSSDSFTRTALLKLYCPGDDPIKQCNYSLATNYWDANRSIVHTVEKRSRHVTNHNDGFYRYAIDLSYSTSIDPIKQCSYCLLA